MQSGKQIPTIVQVFLNVETTFASARNLNRNGFSTNIFSQKHAWSIISLFKTQTLFYVIITNSRSSSRTIFKEEVGIFTNPPSIFGCFKASRRNPLTRFRESWYHDALLHEIQNPYMRIIRKLRLGVSELKSHSWYHNPQKSTKCQHCHTHQDETLEHFFEVCPAFASQRSQFVEKITPILNSLKLPITVASFLGFDKKLEGKRYAKHSKSLRQRLYQCTCDFLKSTSRFEFV